MIAKRRNERFKRIKCSTLARLLRESLAEESIYQLGRDGSDEIHQHDSVSQRGGQPAMMGAAAMHQIPNPVQRGASPNRLGPLRRNEETKDTQSVTSVRTGASVRTGIS